MSSSQDQFCPFLDQLHHFAYMFFICTHIVTLVPATLCLCTNTLPALRWYCFLMYWYVDIVGTVGTLVPVTLCLCTNLLLVPHWYCCLYVLVLWLLLVHWYQPLYVSVYICHWYHTDSALYVYWYCQYCLYIGTSHSISLYQYVTITAQVLLYICTGTVGTVGTSVPAALCLCAYMLLVPHWYSSLHILVLWVLLVHCSHSMSLYQYVTGKTKVLLFICTGTVGTLVPATLCLCAYMLLVLHWYCSSYVLVLWALLVHWGQPLYVSLSIGYWYYSGTPLYMYWYCGCCCYLGTSHSMSLCVYVTGTTLVLLFICTGTVGDVGTLVPATLCLCTNFFAGTTLVLLFICTGIVGTVGTLVPATLCLSTNMLLVAQWYCCYMYWYCTYCWYIGTRHSLFQYQYLTGTALVLLFICTGTVRWVQLVQWCQLLYVSVHRCYCYHSGTALYMDWYCGNCSYISTSHSMSLYQYVTGTALVLLFRFTGIMGAVATLVLATLCLCAYMLLVPH